MAKRKKSARKKRGTWASNDIKILKTLFGDRPTADVAERLGRPTEAVKKKASRMGLRKAKSYMMSLGRG